MAQKKCVVNRTDTNEIESVLVRNPQNNEEFIQSELYETLKQQPLITPEQALDVYKNIYNDSIYPTWSETANENTTELTQEPQLIFRTDSGQLEYSVADALRNSTNFYQAGFLNSQNEFESKLETPIYSKTTQEGQIQNLIKNDFLKSEQVQPNTYEAVDSLSAEFINQELLVTNFNQFQRNQDTFEFGNFEPKMESTTPKSIRTQLRAVETLRELRDSQDKPKTVNYSKPELKSMIESWMKKIGFSFTTIEAYKQRYQNKFGIEPDASALIDLNNRVVAFLDGQVTLDQLSEEFSHLIIEAWDQSEIQRMLQTVQNTREYAQYSQNYREVYSKQISDATELEQAVRKEVLGKMLAESLQSDFSLQDRTPNEQTFFQRLSEILNTVIEFVKSKFQESLRQDLKMMSREIAGLLYNEQLETRLDLERINGSNVMYSLGQQGSGGLSNILSKSSDSIQDLVRGLIRGEKDLSEESTTAVTTFRNSLSTADSCILELNRINQEGQVKSLELNTLIQSVLKTEPLLRQLRSFAQQNDPQFYQKYKDMMSQTFDKLAELEGLDSNTNEAQEPQKVLDAMAQKYSDVSENDLDEIKQGLAEEQGDANLMIKFFGHMSKTSNPLVNLLTMVINNLVNKTKQEFMKDAQEFGSKLINKRSQLKNFVKGQYFKSSVNEEKLQEDKTQYELNIWKKINPGKFAETTIEQYNEEFPQGNRPKTSSQYFYQFEYEYRLGLKDQKWESETRRQYQADFIERIQSIFPDTQNIQETPLFRALMNYEFDTRNSNLINKKAVKKMLLENRRDESNPFLNDGSLKAGFRAMFYYQAQAELQKGLIDANQVVSVNPNFELFEGEKQPNRSDLVFVYDAQTSDEAGQLAYGYMKWNTLSLKEANSNKTDSQSLKENFKTEYERKLNELGAKNLSTQEFDRQLREWLSDAILFEANEEYWQSFDTSGLGIRFDFFRDNGRMDDRKTMREYEQSYKELQVQKQQLLKKYKQANDYKEIDVKAISPTDKNRINSIEAEQKGLRDQISALFSLSEIDMYPTQSTTENSTVRLNQSFYDIFKEFTGTTFQSADERELIKFFTNSDLGLSFEKSTALKKLRDDLKKERDSDFIREQKDLTQSLGLDPENKTDILKAFLQKNAPSWYRRYDANAEYDNFLKEYNSGALDTQAIVQHFLENNQNPLLYNGQPLTMMQISPSFRFTLPQEQSLPELYEQYKTSSTAQDKMRILERMQNAQGIDPEYKNDLSEILNNPQNLETYLELMDAQLQRLDKFESLTRANLFLRPQYRKTNYERTEGFAKSEGKFQQLKDWFKESTSFTKDDLEESYRKNVEDVTQKIPKYGFYKIKNEELTEDIFYSIMKGLEDANHYQQRKQHFQDATSLVQALNGLDFKNGKKPSDTNYYKMMQESLDFNFFGKTVTHRFEFDVMGKTVDLTKFVFGLKNLSVKFALAFSPIVAMTNVSAGITQNIIMRAVGRNIYSKSNDRAFGVMAKLLPDSLKDVGTFDPQSKINKIMYNFGVYNMVDRYRNSQYNKALRLLPETSFGLMAIGNFGLEGQTTLAKLMDIRLIDGQFTDWRRYSTREKTRGEKTNAQIKADFDSSSKLSMYDYIQDDGTFNLQKLEQDGYKGDIQKDQSLAMTQIKSIAELTTMEIAKHHEGYGARDPRASFLLSLKKWLVLAMSTNFSSKRYDFELNGKEEGLLYSPKYMFDLIKAYYKDGKSIQSAWSGLEEYQQKNIKTTGIVTALMIGMVGIAGMLRAEAGEPDESDNYALQLANYLFLRNLNETFSSSIGVGGAVVESLQSPIMAVSSLKSMGEVFNPENFTGVVKSGKYEGMSKLQSAVVKATWLKNIYTASSAETLKTSAQSYSHFNSENFLHIFNAIPEPDEE